MSLVQYIMHFIYFKTIVYSGLFRFYQNMIFCIIQSTYYKFKFYQISTHLKNNKHKKHPSNIKIIKYLKVINY